MSFNTASPVAHHPSHFACRWVCLPIFSTH
jgi:hypothetical protein